MTAKGREKARTPSPDVIKLDADADRKASRLGTDWSAILLIFTRAVACLWILRGLLHWLTIIGSDATPFETLPASFAFLVVFFAVADLIAGVGMWIASAWGGVLWIFSVVASIIVTLAVPQFANGGPIFLAIDFVLIAIYFVLTWQAARERDA